MQKNGQGGLGGFKGGGGDKNPKRSEGEEGFHRLKAGAHSALDELCENTQTLKPSALS